VSRGERPREKRHRLPKKRRSTRQGGGDLNPKGKGNGYVCGGKGKTYPTRTKGGPALSLPKKEGAHGLRPRYNRFGKKRPGTAEGGALVPEQNLIHSPFDREDTSDLGRGGGRPDPARVKAVEKPQTVGIAKGLIIFAGRKENSVPSGD